MKNFLINNWFYILSSISILTNIFFAIYFGIKNWSKARSIYQIERKIIRQARGRRDDLVIEQNLREINGLLNTGKYTIINITSREADGDFEVFLGKIKK